MCGIAGYAGVVADGARVLAALTDAVAHRGPDGAGMVRCALADGRREVGLGHRRLAIIDLVTGDQPMAGADGALQLVFNGEIYNHGALRAELQALGHTFHTTSDTEVLLHAYQAWGDDCVQHLRGMFAFALWDGPRQRLLIARDRYGEKPLYLAEVNGTLAFASELGALLGFPGLDARLNRDVLAHFLQYRYVPGPATWVRGVRKLPPGCLLVWTAQGCTERRWFQPPDARPWVASPPAARHTPASAAEALRERLAETVRLQMQSDVPFGAFLSGGIDSSAIVALMAQCSATPVRTFSVGFAEAAYSELSYCRLVAERFGTQHHELLISPKDMQDALPLAAFHRDAPIAEPADVPIYLLSREARRHVKMVLSGEGSDEVFAGYPKYVFEPHAGRYQRLPTLLRHHLLERWATRLPALAGRIRTVVDSMGLARAEERMPRWFGALSPQEVQALCGAWPSDLSGSAAYPFDVQAGTSALRRVLYFDQTSWLPDNLLERGDRMTMAAGLEARMPFMDHEVIALASSFPDGWRLHGRRGKHILKQAVRPLLPATIIDRPKVGFSMPTEVWLRTSMRDMVGDLLLGTGSTVAGLLRREVLARHVDEHMSGQVNRQKLLWMLLNLELWVRARGLSL
ncbi:asparagine synthase (glutamine-hydrolyzing) [Ideonella sp. A 288]|uniref:asparagine synthase (glutamine-hydrolyzing) n=1 Tax=Ideonella sp. A 288 TaxID=1962181 RepID=UPI000B4B6BD0|nr:asparagine synthase (glutamine-hydrolyzing) [Ideonella sp. A 288]